jgi:hypothetical protein
MWFSQVVWGMRHVLTFNKKKIETLWLDYSSLNLHSDKYIFGFISNDYRPNSSTIINMLRHMPTIFYQTTYLNFKKAQSILFYVSRLLPCNKKPFFFSMMPIVIANNKVFWFVKDMIFKNELTCAWL